MSSLVLLKITVEDEGGGGDDERKTDSTCTNPCVISWKSARISPGYAKSHLLGNCKVSTELFKKQEKKQSYFVTLN